MSQSIIQIKQVSKTIQMNNQIIKAVNNVSFSIDKGELVVILGASGAGKTTLLNLLGGMDSPTAGEIIIDQKDISQFNAKQLTLYRREQVGFVFQFYNLISNLTALENVEFASSYVKNSLDAKEVLNKVGLSERHNNFPSQLSGGEQQRVAIARAVTKNPLLLLCDEPTGALDSITGKDVLKLLTEINSQDKKTIIIITHNSEIAKMADKVIKMKNGQIDDLYLNTNKLSVDEIEW
ncbi:MAG: ABC transporter ATP-binding protein [Streptococcus sp.]|nr:ABC transporter ATP-binding protein [Streptococcus sp.]